MYDRVGSEFIRAVRAHRSQQALSRWLGYRSNPVQEWEGGRRFPVAAEALRACERTGIDVDAAILAFNPDASVHFSLDDEGVARWLEALRGDQPVSSIAEAAGRSRYAVGRWLSGQTRPRLPDFFLLIQVITGRLSDFVAALVDIESVPSLMQEHRTRLASRELAFSHPWSAAILQLLDTEAYRHTVIPEVPWLAQQLGLEADTIEDALSGLRVARLVRRRRHKHEVIAALTVDTRATAEQMAALKRHWVDAASDRLAAPRPDDMFGYNVFGVSREDLGRIQALHLAYYRQVRAIVAESQPVEVAALINVQLMVWDPEASE